MQVAPQVSRFCEAARGLQRLGHSMGGPALLLPRSSISGRCSFWDLQPLGCNSVSATSRMCNLCDIQLVVPRYSASEIWPLGDTQLVSLLLRSSTTGICLWDIQWVVPLFNFCDRQLLGFSCVSAFYVLRPLLPVLSCQFGYFGV